MSLLKGLVQDEIYAKSLETQPVHNVQWRLTLCIVDIFFIWRTGIVVYLQRAKLLTRKGWGPESLKEEKIVKKK